MQTLEQLAQLAAERKKITVEQAKVELLQALEGKKSKFSRDLAISNYFEKISNPNVDSTLGYDPILHHKE